MEKIRPVQFKDWQDNCIRNGNYIILCCPLCNEKFKFCRKNGSECSPNICFKERKEFALNEIEESDE